MLRSCILAVLVAAVAMVSAKESSFSLSADKMHFTGFDAYYKFVRAVVDRSEEVAIRAQIPGTKFSGDSVKVAVDYNGKTIRAWTKTEIVGQNYPTTILQFSLIVLLDNYSRRAYGETIFAASYSHDDINDLLVNGKNWRLEY